MRMRCLRLVQVLCPCLVLSLASLAAATDRYVAQGGTGSTCSSGLPCSVQQCVALANTPGDRCLFQNGTYTGDASILEVSNKTGTSSAPIIFAAINEGQVLLNGQGVRGMIHIYNSDWVEVVGLNTCCASADESGAASAFPLWLEETNNCTIRRVIAWDANGSVSNSVPILISSDGLTGRANDNTLIDVAAWGGGRKAFNGFRDHRTTVLRAFFMKNSYSGSIVDGGVATSYAYDSVDSRRYNVIATGDLAYGGTVTNMYGLFDKDHYLSWCNSSPTDVFHTLRGNIAYHVDGQVAPDTFWAMGLNMGCGQAESSVCPALGPVVHITAENNLAMRRNAAIPGEGMNGIDTCGGQNFYDTWTDSLGSLAGGTHSTDGGNLSYPGGFSNGLLNLGASSQPASGAWIRHPYKADGTLDTTQELWPWPMEARIYQALSDSGYATRGIDGAGSRSVTDTIMALTGSSITPTVPVPPVLLIWPFDEASGTTAADTSGTTPPNNGTLVGSPGHVPGHRGAGALSFNGTTQFVQNTGLSWPVGSPITVSFWAYATDGTAGGGAFGLGGQDDPDRAQCHVPYTDNRLYCQYGSSAGGGININYIPYMNRWTHVTFVSDGSTYQAIYIDGHPATSSSSATAPTTNLTGLTVGKAVAGVGTPTWFKGQLDHFYLENRVLSDTEILAQYQAVANAVSWKFDEASGSTAIDSSPGQLFDGTLINNPTHQAGKVGPFSLGFNGINQQVVHSTFPWPVGTPITIMFWVNTPGSTQAVTVKIGPGEDPDRVLIHAPWEDNILYFDYGGSDSVGRISTNFAAYVNQWTHVAVVNNGTNFKGIYINGAPITSNTTATTPTVDVTGLAVGGDGVSWQTGGIDNVRIEPRVLSAAEILAEFQLGTTITPGLPVGWAPSTGFFLVPN
jgi:hypothetical protein